MALQADSTFGRIWALSAARRAETSVGGTTVRIFPGAPHVNARGLDVRDRDRGAIDWAGGAPGCKPQLGVRDVR
jgi:hypothetical protein